MFKHFYLKIALAITFLLFAFNPLAKAQSGGFWGGGVTLFYSGAFTYQTTVHGGYAFNDRFAILAMGGIAAVAGDGSGSYVAGLMGAYARYTPWHNDILYIDIKPRVEMAFSRGVDGLDIGIVSSLRFRVLPKFEIYADLASLGARYVGDSWVPCIGVANNGATVGVNFLL